MLYLPVLRMSRKEQNSMGRKISFSLEECLAHAKRFETRTQWELGHGSSYRFAKKQGWYDECVAHMVLKMRRPWSKEEILAEAKKYTNVSDWSAASLGSYQASYRLDCYKEATAHMSHKRKWTKAKVFASARRFNRFKDWNGADVNAVKAAESLGCLEEARAHMIVQKRSDPRVWTREKIIQNAARHSEAKQWRKENPVAVLAAQSTGLLGEATAHMVNKAFRVRKRKWSKEKVQAIAATFETRNDWIRRHPKSYHAAQKSGWLNDCHHSCQAAREVLN